MSRLFNAAGEKIELGTSAILDTDQQLNFTVMAWVMMDSVTQDGVAQATKTSGNDGWLLFYDDDHATPKRMDFFVQKTGETQRVKTTNILKVNEWHHYAGVKDDSNSELRIYVDGVLDNTTTGVTAFTPDSSPEPVHIGAATGGDSGTRDLLGKVAHCTFNKVALTRNEINFAMRNGSHPRKLVYHLPLRKAGTAEIDVSGNVHHGTVTGASVYKDPPLPLVYPPPQPPIQGAVPIRKRFAVIEDYWRKKPDLGQISTLNYKQHPRYRGIVGHWMMAESGGGILRDVSGFRNEGTLTSMDATNWVPGQFGKVLDFDGSADFVDFGDVHDFASTEKRSFSCWIKLDATGTTYGLITKQKATSDFAGWNVDVQSDSRVRFQYVESFPGSSLIGVTTAAPIDTANRWYHIVVTYDGSRDISGITIYVDGVSYVSPADENDLTGNIDTAFNMNIGARESAIHFLNGRLDEVRIYNRVLLPAEVRSLYREPFLEFKKEIPFAIPPYRPQAVVLEDWAEI